jgi:hypothetical protein
METQELLTSRQFEAQQMQHRIDELVQRLADRNASIDAQKEVGCCVHHTLWAGCLAYLAAVSRDRLSPYRRLLFGFSEHAISKSPLAYQLQQLSRTDMLLLYTQQ